MNDGKGYFTDPWLKRSAQRGTRLPRNGVFVCAYELHVNPFTVQSALYFRRARARDELWLATGEFLVPVGSDGKPAPLQEVKKSACTVGCACAGPRNADITGSCLSLIGGLIRAMVGFAWPRKFLVPGVVDRPAFEGLVGRLELELKDNAQKARDGETEIVRVARELGLNPEPTGTGPSFWQARCPETSHPVYINAAVNQFGCGWCRRKGGPEELRAFVSERKAQRLLKGY